MGFRTAVFKTAALDRSVIEINELRLLLANTGLVSRLVSTRRLRSRVECPGHVEQMGLHRQPVPLYARRSLGAASYKTLWGEVTTRLSD